MITVMMLIFQEDAEGVAHGSCGWLSIPPSGCGCAFHKQDALIKKVLVELQFSCSWITSNHQASLLETILLDNFSTVVCEDYVVSCNRGVLVLDMLKATQLTSAT